MKRILFPLLFFSLIWGCSNSDTKKEFEHTPHLPVDTFIPKKENILKRQELTNKDEDKLFTDKDFFKATPVDLSLHREMEKVYSEFGDTSTSKRAQTLFKELQKLVNRYPNSTRLLTTLAEYGYQLYPKQSLAYANKAIEIEPSLVEYYILSSQCYGVLGDQDNALSTLKQGKKVAISRLMFELKKPRPYYEPGYHVYSLEQINYAKAYLRKMGYDPGKDVNYKIPKGQVGMSNGMSVTLATYHLSDGTITDMKDLGELDRINAYIKAIENNTPYWDPSDRIMPNSEDADK